MQKINANFDNTLRPQDDLFGYVNNHWLKANPIPPKESGWGTFNELKNQSTNAVKKIVDEIMNKADKSLTHDQRLIKTYFLTALSYMNFKDNHFKTINDELRMINDIKDNIQLSYYLGYAHRCDYSSFWTVYVSVDDKNSQNQILRFHQGGLCLPGRDYYLENTKRMKHIRKRYREYFNAANNTIPNNLPSNFDNILEIEHKLAKSSWTDIELRDIEKNYTKFSIKELQSQYKNFDWLEYFKGLGWKSPSDNIVVDQPSFMDSVFNIVNDYPIDIIKEYLSWHVIDKLFGWIDDNTAKISFNFYGKVITGKLESNPPWKRAVLQSDNLVIGELIGREYAKRYFPESSKKAVLEMVEDVRAAYHERIENVVWMKDGTKKRAHKKLDNIRVLIGYPSVWRDLSRLNLINDNHCANMISARIFKSDDAITKIGKKPDYKLWQMNAHTVNAYCDPNQLVICFPAGILQPPFYNPNANYATNLGGIGTVIGHEFTHGFDDQGAEFDEFGNINRWQSKSEQMAFKKRAKNIIKQANEYEVLPSIFLKGELILGEAIADIGGLEIAIQALKNKSGKNNIKGSINELFINYCKYNCDAQREENLVLQAKTDPHPPNIFRVNCVVMHIDSFYKIFDVRKNDKLYLPKNERAHIW